MILGQFWLIGSKISRFRSNFGEVRNRHDTNLNLSN